MNEQRFHNSIGDDYDLFKIASPHHDELQETVGAILREEIAKTSMDQVRVMELGFGTGITTKIILDSDSKIALTAIDSEPLMAEKIMASPLGSDSRLKIEIADALTFLKQQGNNTFDAVVSAFVLHNFLKSYRTEVLKEIFRVLKSNGLFINADKIADSDVTVHKENLDWQIKQFDVFNTINRPELKSEWTKHYLEDDKPDRVLVEDQFNGELESIGFKSHALAKRWHDDAIVLAQR